MVGPMFFETMQIPMPLGRAIDAHDVDGAPLAAVVNEIFAKNFSRTRTPSAGSSESTTVPRTYHRRRREERPL